MFEWITLYNVLASRWIEFYLNCIFETRTSTNVRDYSAIIVDNNATSFNYTTLIDTYSKMNPTGFESLLIIYVTHSNNFDAGNCDINWLSNIHVFNFKNTYTYLSIFCTEYKTFAFDSTNIKSTYSFFYK